MANHDEIEDLADSLDDNDLWGNQYVVTIYAPNYTRSLPTGDPVLARSIIDNWVTKTPEGYGIVRNLHDNGIIYKQYGKHSKHSS